MALVVKSEKAVTGRGQQQGVWVRMGGRGVTVTSYRTMTLGIRFFLTTSDTWNTKKFLNFLTNQ